LNSSSFLQQIDNQFRLAVNEFLPPNHPQITAKYLLFLIVRKAFGGAASDRLQSVRNKGILTLCKNDPEPCKWADRSRRPTGVQAQRGQASGGNTTVLAGAG
jgi:hypothetical protein